MLKTLNPCGIRELAPPNSPVTCNGLELGCTIHRKGYMSNLTEIFAGVGNANNQHLCCNAFGDEPVCQYLGKSGCTVKSLRCRLWVCSDSIMLPISPKVGGATQHIMGPTEAHPNRNYYLGQAWFPFISEEHKAIFKEAEKYRFLRFFRQGKTVAVNYAYATRDRIDLDA